MFLLNVTSYKTSPLRTTLPFYFIIQWLYHFNATVTIQSSLFPSACEKPKRLMQCHYCGLRNGLLMLTVGIETAVLRYKRTGEKKLRNRSSKSHVGEFLSLRTWEELAEGQLVLVTEPRVAWRKYVLKISASGLNTVLLRVRKRMYVIIEFLRAATDCPENKMLSGHTAVKLRQDVFVDCRMKNAGRELTARILRVSLHILLHFTFNISSSLLSKRCLRT